MLCFWFCGFVGFADWNGNVQVANANVAEWKDLRNLLSLREEAGELSAADERKLAQVRSEAERAVLAAADVICCTCVAAGDRRLLSMRFHRVRPCVFVARVLPFLSLHLM